MTLWCFLNGCAYPGDQDGQREEGEGVFKKAKTFAEQVLEVIMGNGPPCDKLTSIDWDSTCDAGNGTLGVWHNYAELSIGDGPCEVQTVCEVPRAGNPGDNNPRISPFVFM